MKHKGSIRDCLEHFFKKIAGNKEEEAALLKFVGTNDVTVLRRWESGKNYPSGPFLIKIAFYIIHKFGYEIEEITSLPEANRSAIMGAMTLVALGIMTTKEAAQKIGYKYDFDLYPVLIGRRGSSGSRLQKMKELYSLHRPEALDRMHKIFKETAQITEVTEPKKNALEKKETKDNLPHFLTGGLDQLIVNLLRALDSESIFIEPLLDYFINKATAEERQSLRNDLQNGSQRGIFQVSNPIYRVAEKINALCTEKSLEMYKQKNLKK